MPKAESPALFLNLEIWRPSRPAAREDFFTRYSFPEFSLEQTNKSVKQAVNETTPTSDLAGSYYNGHAQSNEMDEADPVPLGMGEARTDQFELESTREALPAKRQDEFVPLEPTTLAQSKLTVNDVEPLLLKTLLNAGSATGRRLAEQIRLPFGLVHGILDGLKHQMLVSYKNAAAMGDYEYELSQAGTERARRFSDQCTYFGAAPVALEDYVDSVAKQALRKAKPRFRDVRAGFSDLLLAPEVISNIGQAVNAGQSLFLYGAPGNGKTSIAERLMRCVGEAIWIPRTIAVGREIIRLFDPTSHNELPSEESEDLLKSTRIDQRWVRIQRPTVVVGGELTLEHLEVTTNSTTGIHEAPLQFKANCGALVIDDFGRQRISKAQLLNRWIVPMEKRIDHLALPSGRQFNVPFEQLLVFATNLDPKQLVDEAFLRRIPYKIEVCDPSEEDFALLFDQQSAAMGLPRNPNAASYLISEHFLTAGRPFRFCYVRDLLERVQNFCEFHERPLELSEEVLDTAVSSYFAGL